MRIPLPSVPQQPTQSGRFGAPSVVPMQNFQPQQGAALGQAIERGGYQISRIADFQQDALDDARVTDRDNLTSDAIRKALHDPQNGYLSKIGANALDGSRQQIEEDLDQKIEEIGASLDNDVQREQWKRMAADRRLKASALMDGHEADQTFNHKKGATEARIEASRIDGNQSLMLMAVDDLSGMLGEDETQRDQRRLDENTKFHEERIRILAQQDPESAAKMLKDANAKREIHPARQDELRKLVQQSDVDDRSLALFSTIVNDPTRQDMPLSEQERIARSVLTFELEEKRLTAGVYDATLKRVEHHFAQQQELRNQQRRETADELDKVFVRDPALRVDTLPQLMREQIERLGMVGDADRIESEVRGRRIAESKRAAKDIEMTIDMKNVETLNNTIKHLDEMSPPEGADEATVKEFDRLREEKIVALKEMRAVLDERIVTRIGVELPAAPKPTNKKRTIAEEVSDALQAARGALGR